MKDGIVIDCDEFTEDEIREMKDLGTIVIDAFCKIAQVPKHMITGERRPIDITPYGMKKVISDDWISESHAKALNDVLYN